MLLITGSNGVLGTKLIQQALEKRLPVLAVDIQDTPHNSYLGNFQYQRVDITNEGDIAQVFQDHRIDTVIHRPPTE